MEQTLCVSNRYLQHRKKGTQRKLKSKIRYQDITCNRVVKKKKYDDKRAISITNLVETTWLTRYSIPREITYDKGFEFIGHEFIKPLIET